MTKPAKTGKRTVIRQARVGFDKTTGVRRTTVEKRGHTDKKVHNPVDGLDRLIVKISLPSKFEARTIPAKGDRVAIDYEEYQIPCSGSSGAFIKMNAFFGPQAAGTTVTAQVKIGLQTISRKNREGGQTEIENFYLKVEPTIKAVTHTLQIDVNGLAVDDAIKAGEIGVVVIDLSTVNPNVSGGFIVKPI
jgi:hypothetical protein